MNTFSLVFSRFENEAACNAMCRNPPGSGKCYLPKVSGPCRGQFPKFYFDQEEQQCKEFTYSGCLGNANRFETLEECEQSCMPTPEDQDLCNQRYEPGPCRYEKNPMIIHIQLPKQSSFILVDFVF